MHRVADRVLSQFPALTAYFESLTDVNKPGRAKRLVERFSDPFTKLTLLFLQFIVPVLTEFNKLFQVRIADMPVIFVSIKM